MRHITRIFLFIAALVGFLSLGGVLPPAHAAELTFTGKLACYIKRPVMLPVAADITSLNVQPGTKVKAGEILGRYRLIPESLQSLHRRLLAPQILDMRAKMAEFDKGLETLENKRNTLLELSRQNMAPAQSLTQVDQEIKALTKQRSALQEGLGQAERTKAEEEALARKQLGVPFKSGQIPKEGVLVAPIDGYVVWMHPDLRQGAELGGGTPVLMIGVMDPMLVRAPVHEIEALKLKAGDEADLTIESLPGQKFSARVSRLPWAPPAISLDHPTYYDVEFKVANPDMVLREGLKATIEIRRTAGQASAETTQENETTTLKGAQGKK
jgi:multidrug resistance efflux pump